MRKLLRFLALAFILFTGINAFGQQTPAGYNPFVPVNLNDTSKLKVIPVVESSYHRYWVKGDPNYTDTSTFVWYVENGTFGTYDTITDIWTPMDTLLTFPLGKGRYTELKGFLLNSVHNSSEIWVRWNNGTGDSIGIIASYERSYDNCIVDDLITGFKHNIVFPPEIWFVVGNREECSDQAYSVTVRFNNLYDYSFPYRFSFTYPDINGQPQTRELRLNSRGELDISLEYTFDLEAVQDLNVTLDETYTIRLDELRDKYGAVGFIAPLGPPQQYAQLTLTIFHLPQTRGMTMD